ncbi:MAG: hypothetical protein FWD83_08140, partial [Promicromonosporaceae bacterium]|nr:hypothetical protein [Promicromonosporaceae bacterium]
VVAAEVSAETVEAAVWAGVGELAEAVTLFDVYTGEQLGAGKKSLAYSVRLRATDRTLSAEDIRAAREAVVVAAAEIGATLRA